MPCDITHPGKMLLDEFMKPAGLSTGELADALCVSDAQIAGIIAGRCQISEIMAIRLAKYFNTSQLIWLGSPHEGDKAA